MKIDNMKEEKTQDKEKSQKKRTKQKCKKKKKKKEGQSSRLEQAEDRISEFEDEMVIKGKTEKLLNNSRPVTPFDSIKRQNLRIMGIEEGEEVQAKGMCNIFNKIITEKFPNLEKTMHIQIQEASRTPHRPDLKRNTP
jgi:hypothetical protein